MVGHFLTKTNLSSLPRDINTGLWLGALGVLIFAMTLPLTRLAVGTLESPGLSPWFVTFGRAALAGVISAFYLVVTHAPIPNISQSKHLASIMLCLVFGFPILIAFALQVVTSGHAAVITALLPLITAMMAAWLFKHRAPIGFWICASMGALLVISFAILESHQTTGSFILSWADMLLLGSVLAAAWGYTKGAQVTPELGAERVICWICVMGLPFSIPGALAFWPNHSMPLTIWLSFAYLGIFSMWLGFFAWYRGLQIGGTLIVSQVQLVQPFLSIVAAATILGESLDALTVCFALAVVGTVFLGKHFSQRNFHSDTS